MTALTPVNQSRHSSQTWRRVSSYAFAADRPLVPLVAAEFALAMFAFPIAFVSKESGFAPVALLGIETGSSLFVSPDGRWLGSYVPAVLRSYPFTLAPTADGQQVVCVDEASGLISSHDAAGEPFFDPSGGPSAALQGIIDFLQKVEENRAGTMRSMQSLQACDLLEPWPVGLHIDDRDIKLEGLWRISEGKLKNLPDEQFVGLRRSGALQMAYVQLLSMHRVSLLAELAAARPGCGTADLHFGRDIDLSWMNGDTIRFG